MNKYVIQLHNTHIEKILLNISVEGYNIELLHDRYV